MQNTMSRVYLVFGVKWELEMNSTEEPGSITQHRM